MTTLEIHHIQKRFKDFQALNDITLQIKSGLFGLLGPNGAGKTTLMRIIATVMQPDYGTISFGELDWSKNPDSVRQTLGYLPQDFGAFNNITAAECLDYIASLKGIHQKSMRRELVQSALKKVNLVEHTKKKVGAFSCGMRRRLGIAQAILGDPKLIIVDEPTAGLDPEERIRFRGLLRSLAQDRIVLLSTHIIEDVQASCDGVAVIKQGKAKQFESMDKLATLANDRVWTWNIREEDYEKISNQHKVISSKIKDRCMEIRVLAQERPSLDATLASPTIEEGYLAWIAE